LAGDIGERQLWRPAALERAARYIEATWQAQGYQVARQSVVAEGKTVYNLETEFSGGRDVMNSSLWEGIMIPCSGALAPTITPQARRQFWNWRACWRGSSEHAPCVLWPL